MHEWMVQSGIPLENAVNYEVTIRSVHYSVQALNRSSSLAIGILIMDGNVRNASSLKACLGKLANPLAILLDQLLQCTSVFNGKNG